MLDNPPYVVPVCSRLPIPPGTGHSFNNALLVPFEFSFGVLVCMLRIVDILKRVFVFGYMILRKNNILLAFVLFSKWAWRKL